MKKLLSAVLLTLFLFALASCGYDEEDIPVFYIKNGTEAYDPSDELIDEFYSTFHEETEPYEPKQTEASDTSKNTETDDLTLEVYWVSGGEVWHVTDKCSSLSRSKKILSGTVEDAVLAGKTRVCKKCGK